MPGVASGPAGAFNRFGSQDIAMRWGWGEVFGEYIKSWESPQVGHVPGLLAAGVASCRTRISV